MTSPSINCDKKIIKLYIPNSIISPGGNRASSIQLRIGGGSCCSRSNIRDIAIPQPPLPPPAISPSPTQTVTITTTKTPTITTTPTVTPTVTPILMGAFYSPDTAWSSIGFSGEGTLNNKYLGSWTTQGTLNEISIYVASTGKLHITADYISSDDALQFLINSISRLSLGDYNGYSSNSFNFETLVVANGTNNNVNAGDLIKIYDPYSNLQFTNLRIWWTAT
jgi:hypothetical protein